MNRIASADAEFRRTVFNEAGIRQKMSPAMIEKDFWVCWMLGLLFDHPEWRKGLVFKGGTSLSKVFNAVRRFSEDIDLSLCPEVLGVTSGDVEKADSRKKRDQLMKYLEVKCSGWVKTRVQPELEAKITGVLGWRSGDRLWLEYESDSSSHSPVLFFYYPSEHADGLPYIKRAVKLEFGSLADQQPTGTHRVRPWVADSLPAEMREMGCEVVALEIERSFWEKATILHAEYHRDPLTPLPARYSRHYSDMATLFRTEHSPKALRNAELRQRVVEWKDRFFSRAWARYDLAKPGTFRILPPEVRRQELERDYREMRDMFVDNPPSFQSVMDTLKELENAINRKTENL